MIRAAGSPEPAGGVGGARHGDAKLFWTGRSQAVRLPTELRFAGQGVRIRRQGDAVILELVARDWAWLDAPAGRLDADAAAAAAETPGGAAPSSIAQAEQP